jgi:hypothetical protein
VGKRKRESELFFGSLWVYTFDVCFGGFFFSSFLFSLFLLLSWYVFYGLNAITYTFAPSHIIANLMKSRDTIAYRLELGC